MSQLIGFATVELSKTVLMENVSLFSGECIEIMGGVVHSNFALTRFATPKLTKYVSAATENRRNDIEAAVSTQFFSTSKP